MHAFVSWDTGNTSWRLGRWANNFPGEQAHLREDWSAEILLGLRAVLFKLSIWDHDASYGTSLQHLRYVDARHMGPMPRAPSRWQKGLYGLVAVGGRYAWHRWEEWLAEQEGDYDEVAMISNVSKAVYR